MAESREEQIAAALNSSLRMYQVVNKKCPEEVQSLIRQRVRELCRQRGCEMLYIYDKEVDEIEGWFHQILLKEIDGSYERRPSQHSEAAAWEEALLWLVEKGEKE